MKITTTMTIASLALALLSTPALAAGGTCISCIEHEQALKAGPADGYLHALRDEYKPIIIVIDRSTTPPTVSYRVAFGGGCGGCGGRDHDAGTHTGGVNNGVAGTGLSLGQLVAGAISEAISGGAGTGLDNCGCHTADTTTGNTGLGGGTGLGIGN